MTKMTTCKTTLSVLLHKLDMFGALFFTAPHVEIEIEVPVYLVKSLDLDPLNTVLKIKTAEGRLIAGTAAAFARRAAAALADLDAVRLDALIENLDSKSGWTCYHYEDDLWNDRIDDPDDYVRECLILSNIETEVTFYVYLTGAGDLLYGEV